MNTLQTLEMALEALDNLAHYADLCEQFLKETHPGKSTALRERVTKAIPAITALRQQIALEKMAENERELGIQMQPDEPVACGNCNGSGRMVRDPDIGTDQECFVCEGSGVFEDTRPQPADEDWKFKADYWKRMHDEVRAELISKQQPAAQWVGLTRDELFEIAGDSPDYFDWKVFARAIEAKLREKNT